MAELIHDDELAPDDAPAAPGAEVDDDEPRPPLRPLPSTPADGRVTVHTLTLMRWIGISGQILTIIILTWVLRYQMPVGPILATILASVLLNLVVITQRGTQLRLSDRDATFYLGYDTLQLTLLLYLTGGLANPFAILLLAPLMIRHSAWSYWQSRKAFQEQARELLARVGLAHRLLHAGDGLRELATDVDVGRLRADRVGPHRAAFDQGVRGPAHDLAVLERARLGLVRVDDEVGRLARALGEEARLAAHREARAAASANACVSFLTIKTCPRSTASPIAPIKAMAAVVIVIRTKPFCRCLRDGLWKEVIVHLLPYIPSSSG